MIEYDPHRWRDFFRLGGHMFATISARAGWILLLAIAVTVAHEHWRPLEIRSDAHGLIGPALSLLLVFRTNASYDRFWEGRKLWGSIVNTSRGLARMATVHLESAARDRAIDLIAAFPTASMHELRGNKSNPLQIATQLSRVFNQARSEGRISEQVYVQMESQTQTLVDCLGGCERIHKTPLPFAYVMHLRRALILYCVTLPFALVSHFGYATSFVAFFISLVLLGIEEIGVEIEDPFGTDDNDLPLEQICAGIESTVRSFREHA